MSEESYDRTDIHGCGCTEDPATGFTVGFCAQHREDAALSAGPACKICNDTGMVLCAEQDGTGMYEQACPEPVHDGETDDWEPCGHDHDEDCYDCHGFFQCHHQHCFNCGGCGCPGYCDDYQTYNLRPGETGGVA